MTFKIGIMGGSGLEDPQILHNAREVEVTTPYGKPSDKYIEGESFAPYFLRLRIGTLANVRHCSAYDRSNHINGHASACATVRIFSNVFSFRSLLLCIPFPRLDGQFTSSLTPPNSNDVL